MTVEATIINATKDNNYAYLFIAVTNDAISLVDGKQINVEYNAQTPLLNPDGTVKSNAQLKSELIALCKAQRDAQKQQIQSIPITGTVTI